MKVSDLIYTLETGIDYGTSTHPRHTHKRINKRHTHKKSSNWAPCIRTGAVKGLLNNQRGIDHRKTWPRLVRLEKLH